MYTISISDFMPTGQRLSRKITKLVPSPLEIAESLEQNRWIENGFRIRTAVTIWESIGIDTPDDLDRATIIFRTKYSVNCYL